MKKTEIVTISISIDKKLDGYITELITNRSKYINYLIYQDLLEKGQDVKKIMI